MALKKWVCSVCGFAHFGSSPPDECPQCSSSSKEFSLFRQAKKLRYDGRKFDVLLINGSSHRAHNTGMLADIAESELKRNKVSYKRFNLNELNIMHCWCCYSMKDAACTYPCRNQHDDAPALHEMIINSKAVIIASPINWNNMPGRLKDFLDRLTCVQNIPLLGKKSLTSGKVFGVIVNGHEDGAVKTAMDIFLYFQQMGYIFAPFGFAYRTHNAAFNTKDDYKFLANDKEIAKDVKNVVSNVIALMKQNLEKKMRSTILPACE